MKEIIMSEGLELKLERVHSKLGHWRRAMAPLSEDLSILPAGGAANKSKVEYFNLAERRWGNVLAASTTTATHQRVHDRLPSCVMRMRSLLPRRLQSLL